MCVCVCVRERERESVRARMTEMIRIRSKLQAALVYDILFWRKVPESDDRSVDSIIAGVSRIANQSL